MPKVTAKLDDNQVMAVEHKKLPIYGIQFHPESILTEDGIKFLSSCVGEDFPALLKLVVEKRNLTAQQSALALDLILAERRRRFKSAVFDRVKAKARALMKSPGLCKALENAVQANLMRIIC